MSNTALQKTTLTQIFVPSQKTGAVLPLNEIITLNVISIVNGIQINPYLAWGGCARADLNEL